MLLFFLWEYLLLPGHRLAQAFPLQQAMIPLRLLWSRNAGLLSYINFITGMGEYYITCYALINGLCYSSYVCHLLLRRSILHYR